MFYNNGTGYIYTLTKEGAKDTCHMRHSLSSANFSMFSEKLTIFAIFWNKDKSYVIVGNFWLSSSFYWIIF